MITEAKIHELLDEKIEKSYTNHKKEVFKYTTSLREQIKDGRIDFNIDNIVFSEVQKFGGTEGSGEEHWVVFSTESGGDIQYFKVPGWYQSYNGGELELENLYEVTPGEVMVRIWNKK